MSRRESGEPSKRLHLRAASFQEFIEEYSSRVSPEGVLLPTDQAMAEGAPVEFEISLSDDFRVLRGAGEVEWYAGPEEGEEKAGLAVRFTQIEAPSRRLIDRLVERHRSAGGTLFSLVRWPGSVSGGSGLSEEPPALPGPAASEWVEEPAPQIILDEPAAAGPLGGRPSRTPAGDDSVLIPAPALDGEPLPAEPPVAVSSEGRLEADSFQDGSQPALDAWSEEEPPSPADTLHLSELGSTEDLLGDPDAAEALGTETLRVDGLQPPPPSYPQIPPPVELPSPMPSEPPPPFAGVGRASGADRRRPWLLLVLLAALAIAAWLGTGTELVRRLWKGSQGEPVPRAVATQTTVAPPAPGAEPVPQGEVSGDAPATGGEPVSAPSPNDGGDLPETLPAAPPSSPAAGAPTEPPVEPAPVAVARLTRIVDVESARSGSVTEIRLVADGQFVEGGFNGTRVQGGAPRILIRVLGVAEPFSRTSVPIGTPEVERVRVGLHRTGDRLDLHFVADLTSGAIRLVSAEASGQTLALRFSR